MKEHITATQQNDQSEIDYRLRPLLTANEDQYNVLLQEVIERHAEPLIRKIISVKLRVSSSKVSVSSDAEALDDLCQEALVSLVTYIKMSRQHPAEYAIKALDEFAATVAFNAYNKYLREKYPFRHRLKKKLYYLLHHRERLALWKERYDWVSGLSLWKNLQLAKRHSQALDDLKTDEWGFIASKLNGKVLSTVPMDLLLIALFEWLGHPLELDLLVDTVSGLLKIKDYPSQDSSVDKGDARANQGLEIQLEYVTRVELQGILKRLWEEIKALPERQRWALLCSLRDSRGDGLVNALSSCGIASPQQIAKTLGIGVEELITLWNQFPLKDSEIAVRLNVTKQQVINLRKSARERLGRRLVRINH